jgi:hypothetical protein
MSPIDPSPHAGEIMQPPERVIPQRMDPDVPSPEPVPRVNRSDPQPGDPKPKAPLA